MIIDAKNNSAQINIAINETHNTKISPTKITQSLINSRKETPEKITEIIEAIERYL